MAGFTVCTIAKLFLKVFHNDIKSIMSLYRVYINPFSPKYPEWNSLNLIPYRSV